MITRGSSTFTIAPFDTEVDVPAEIARLHLVVRREQAANDQNTFVDIYDSQPDLNAIEAFYVVPGGIFFIAKDSQGNVAGFVGLKYVSPGQAELKRLAVLPEYRRQGLGTQLVRSLIAWATDQGFETIHLWTGRTERARPIYEKCGFTVVAFRQKDQAWLMTLDLRASSPSQTDSRLRPAVLR